LDGSFLLRWGFENFVDAVDLRVLASMVSIFLEFAARADNVFVSLSYLKGKIEINKKNKYFLDMTP
jgi:hypothetical protein